MIRTLLPVMALLLVAGCASDSDGMFTKPGVSSAQQASDKQFCMSFAERGHGMAMGGPRAAAERSAERAEMFDRCMMDRGYRKL